MAERKATVPRRTDTSIEAYKSVLDEGTDVTQQRRIAAMIGKAPDGLTIEEIAKEAEHIPSNSVQPRVNELLRRGIVYREGERETDSGKQANVHYLTEVGEQFVRGEADPEEDPSLAEQERRIRKIARKVKDGEADMDILEIAFDRYDEFRRRHDPDWEPE